jgi:hypothetical protein
VREGGLRAQPLQVLPGGDQQLAGVDGADAKQGGGARCGPGDQAAELLVELAELLSQGQGAVGDSAQGQLGGLAGILQPGKVGP